MLRSVFLIRLVRFWLPVALALSLGACATQTLEERLTYLEVLKSRGTITEEEYAILRRRLVETVDVTSLRAPPDPAPPSAESGQPPEPLSVEWIIGSWSGSHTGGGSWHWDVATIVEFSLAGTDIEWTMTRRFRSTVGVSVATASGTAVVREGRLEMTGVYVDGSHMVTDGTPVEYSLQRAGADLEGFAAGGDPRTRTLILHRVQR